MNKQNRTIAVVVAALAGGAVAFVVLELSGIGWFGIGLALGAAAGGWLARLLIPLRDDS